AEPLRVKVQAHSVVGIDAENETRFPTGSPYSLTFSAPGDTGIVVDREIAVPPGSTAPQTGEVRATPGGSERLLVPSLAPPGSGVQSLAISDVTSRPVSVTVTDAQDGATEEGLSRRLVSPRQPLVVVPQPGSPVGSEPMVVSASGPVAVEVDAGPTGSQGLVVLPALAAR
ncbi:MAG: hypothetical protein ACRDV4_03485, partial [Acidimicrobiales bacterium]